MNSISNKYDPNTVIAASNEKLAKNDIEGGQYIFQSALFEWVDDACEGGVSGLTEAVATLWLAYANFLITAQQYKTAGDIYEEAIRCPVTKHVGRIYAEYARFAVERNKRKTAQDVYIRALVSENQGRGAVQDEQDREFLWNEFLEMMKTTNPTLTMDALKEAVEQKHTATMMSLSEPETITSQTATTSLEPAAKRARIETEENTAATATVTRTHVVTEESVQELSLKFFQEWNVNTSSSSTNASSTSPKHLGLPAELATAWMIIDGSHPPTIPETMLFEPSPPKLSDPTAKDILGVELAAQLVECLLSPSGGVVLEVCRGLWILQALKEQDAARRIESYDQNVCQENERIEGELEARLSVAGAVAEAVRLMNDRERQSFRSDAVQKRQSLITDLAWEFRQLLYWQQMALAKLQIPGMEEGPTVDSYALHLQSQICRFLHSAFYIRNRMGVEPHEAVLKNQLKKLEKDLSSSNADKPSQSPKRGVTTTVPPLARHSPLPPPANVASYQADASQATMSKSSSVFPSQIPPPPPPPPPTLPPQYSFPMTMQQQQQQPPGPPVMGMMNAFSSSYTQQPQQTMPMMNIPTVMQPPFSHHAQQQQQQQHLLPPLPPPPPPRQSGPYPGQQQHPYYH